MIRPWQTWGAFAVCLALLFVAMGWITRVALSLERSEREARQLAAREENVRLALWRMETALAPLIAAEGGRPYSAYKAFYSPARAFSGESGALVPGEVLLSSPLLVEIPADILLHFQVEPDGQITSPQVPIGELRKLAEAGYIAEHGLYRE